MMKAFVSNSKLLVLLLATLVSVQGQDDAEMCSANGGGAPLTGSDMMGPFYVAGSPIRKLLAPAEQMLDMANVLLVKGKVLGDDCVPLANAVVEAWYAGEEKGDVIYFNDKHRGQLVTDECGSFEFQQTYPALYPQRPIIHIHYRISSAEGVELLVTQLYFEDSIPAGFAPDESKIVAVDNEDDGSRSVVYNVYVGVPGTADAASCSASEATMAPSLASSMADTMADSMLQASTLVPTTESSIGSTTTATTADTSAPSPV